MTDEQINHRIAEACGLKPKRRPVFYPRSGMKIEAVPPPNYCTDLNAMHEAEKALTKEQVREYQCYMYDMACEIDNTCGRWMPYSATARYRAEALLKTLGKWEEVQG